MIFSVLIRKIITNFIGNLMRICSVLLSRFCSEHGVISCQKYALDIPFKRIFIIKQSAVLSRRSTNEIT